VIAAHDLRAADADLPSTSVTSVSKTGTPTVPILRTPERHDGLAVAPIVTSVSP
jgi:hypothetical protein